MASVCDFLIDAAREHPQRPALVTGAETLSYATLGARAAAVAKALSTMSGRRVGLLAENGIDYLVLYWGVLLAGRTCVEFSPTLAEPELHRAVEAVTPDLVIAQARFGGLLHRLVPGAVTGSAIAVTGPDTAVLSMQTLEDALTGAAPLPPAPFDGADTAAIVFTSGTTGETRGVCLGHDALHWVCSAIATSFDLGENERFAGVLPFYHSYGKSLVHLAARQAAPLVLSPHVASPGTLIELIARERLTHVSLVPYQVALLLRTPGFDSTALPDIRRITVAGGALDAALETQLAARFAGRVVPMYGLTEAATRVTCMPAGELARHPGSCGRPLDGVEVRLVDENASPCTSGATGEILVRGPNLMQGYWADPAASATTLADGWLHTGDLGQLDADGYLTIVGRLKDMIKVMGESVPARRIEEVVQELPGIAAAAAVAIPHAVQGEAIRVYAVAEAPGTADAARVRRHCAARLGRARVPAEVIFVDELPRTASGKIRKHLLGPG